LQQTENTIRLQVRQAQFALQQNYVGLQAAIAARDYAAQNLDAEQKKLRMGASTSTLVLQASSALTQAESNVLVAATNYEKSKVQLDLSTAETLKRLGIEMSDAEAAKVQHPPKVPGVVPANTNDLTQPNLTPIPVPGVTAPAAGTPPQNPAQPPQGTPPH
jgi:outer membrane protein